ncbi:MAG: flagellar biosynthetic protein FliR [Alphaproteobacteria bacterium]
MQSALDAFLSGSLLAFFLVFARLGTAIMLMPGIGDTYVSPHIRLSFALGLSVVLFPMILPYVPSAIPALHGLVFLILVEMVTGLLIGSVARIFMMALDTGGMIISMQSGLANAQVLNPALATQGSLIGAFLMVTGVVVVFATHMHHILIVGIMDSYKMFPIGGMPDAGSMAEVISKAVANSFMIGIKLSMPFIVMTLLIYAGMGVMSRVMPQLQVFMVILPLQILLSFILLILVLTAVLYYWAEQYEAAIFFFFSNGASPI